MHGNAPQHVKRFRAFERVAQRKLRQLDIAVELRDLALPPGNRLETLKSNRKGQHSIRINDQGRNMTAQHSPLIQYVPDAQSLPQLCTLKAKGRPPRILLQHR